MRAATLVARGLLQSAAVDPGAALQARVVGRYALYDAIAAGGMATVHLGRLLGQAGFERTVAIKRLHPQFAQDPEFVSMFLDEARVVARIRHPNVVPTLDVVSAEGELFIVMEYVQGESLARLIRAAGARGARMPPAFATTIVSGVLHGLHAAHEARSERGQPLDVVHRDISPQNILVGTDGVARVLDFGVAKAAGRLQTTREGQLKGKIAYMAPEQMSGITSRATDVYAASVVLWEALTGRRLFFADNEAHTMKLVLDNRVARPGEIVADLPPALDALVLRGLSREPADRFATARDMALALEEALPPATPSKIGAWVEATAARTLDDRSERIARIESQSSHGTPLGKGTDDAAPVVATPAAAPAARADDEPPTQLSSSATSLPDPSSKGTGRSGRSRALLALAGGGAMILALLVVTVSRRAVTPATSLAGPPPSPAPSDLVPPAMSPAALAAPVTPSTSVAPPAPAASIEAPSSASIPARPPPRPQRPLGPKPPAARNPGADDGTSDRK
jgi:serine/threonine-protein kinase